MLLGVAVHVVATYVLMAVAVATGVLLAVAESVASDVVPTVAIAIDIQSKLTCYNRIFNIRHKIAGNGSCFH